MSAFSFHVAFDYLLVLLKTHTYNQIMTGRHGYPISSMTSWSQCCVNGESIYNPDTRTMLCETWKKFWYILSLWRMRPFILNHDTITNRPLYLWDVANSFFPQLQTSLVAKFIFYLGLPHNVLLDHIFDKHCYVNSSKKNVCQALSVFHKYVLIN